MNKDVLTAVEITDTHLKLLQVRRIRRRPVLTRCDIRPISSASDEETGRILVEVLGFRGIPPSSLMVVLPRRFVILKPMRLPSHNEREIIKMMHLQLVNQIPYPVEDVACHYYPLEKEPSGYARGLAVIIHKEVSRRYLGLFSRTGAHPEKFFLSSFGLLGWLNYQMDRQKIASDQPVLLLNLDAGQAEICFCHNRRLLFSRSVQSGIGEETAQEEDGLLRQVELSFKNYRKENMGPAVQKILIVSTLPQAGVLKSQLEEALSVPAQVLSPLENILCPSKIDLSTLKNQPGLSLSAALGLLLSDPKELINLIPAEVHEKRRSQIRRGRWIQCAGLLFFIFLLGLSSFGMEVFQKMRSLEEMKQALDGIGPRLKEIQRKQELVEVLDRELQRRVFIADVIDELGRLTPADVSFRSLSLEENGRFTIQGYAPNGAGVNNFQAGLVKSPVFREVNLEYVTKRKIFNMEITDFKITSKLRDGS